MATVSSAIWDTAGITAFQALQVPFLITNYPLAAAVEGGPIGQAMLASANTEAGDVVALAIHEGGLRKPLGKEPLASVADFKGKTIRAPQSQVPVRGLQGDRRERRAAAAARGLPGPARTGPWTAPRPTLALIYTQKWYEQAKYVTGNLNFWPFPTVLVINKAVYDGLTAAQQTALTDAAANITASSIKIFTTPGSTVAQDLVNCGIKYVTATQADITALTNASAGAVTALAPESQDFAKQIEAEDLPRAAGGAAAVAHDQDRGVHAAPG